MMLSKCLDYDPEALEVVLVHGIVFWAACHQLHGKGYQYHPMVLFERNILVANI